MNDKRSFVRDMFAHIAPRYDLGNRLMTFGRDQSWRIRTARAALTDSTAAPRILDLATGTGDLVLAIRQLKPGARIVGLDLTYEMLDLALVKMRQSSARSAVDFVNGDTLDLPFPDNTFDAITSGFMLRNLVDLDKGFREMVRVTRPGGRVAALEITRPTLPFWSQIFHIYFYSFVPLLMGAVSGAPSAYRYLPNSLTSFTAPEALAQVMRGAGLRDVHYALLNLGSVAIHYGVK